MDLSILKDPILLYSNAMATTSGSAGHAIYSLWRDGLLIYCFFRSVTTGTSHFHSTYLGAIPEQYRPVRQTHGMGLISGQTIYVPQAEFDDGALSANRRTFSSSGFTSASSNFLGTEDLLFTLSWPVRG